ncbi:MAG: RidA family protein, partial [Alphaproteobacteria bacterium]|nr:RidA family protein [Alphaproteobacteria bacterium]
MSKRQSIEFPGFSHANPIPGASRIGNIMMSSVIAGRDPASNKMPDELDQQIVNIFSHVRSAVEAAGGSPDDLVAIEAGIGAGAAVDRLINLKTPHLGPDPILVGAKIAFGEGLYTGGIAAAIDAAAAEIRG